MIENEQYLNAVAEAIENSLNKFYGKEMGFALIVFEFDSESGDYVSNAKRKDMIKALREAANRIEKNSVIPPAIGTA